ncbi:PP2C family protein-serine/threonine phosphatase [Streptomyces sp. NPDC093252]|uniref:PP2C family protein-serine/threonine phosphatase n=1 Tax=Streptomyces sp. NPDC093252 TaxID=3154980 RepID=UPI00342CEE97
MARSFESLQGPATVEPTGPGASPDGGAPPPLSLLRPVVARIGTTLDEATTRAELAREAAAQLGAAAGVLPPHEDSGPAYTAVGGNPDLLPGPGAVLPAARSAPDGTLTLATASGPVLVVPLTAQGHGYGFLVCARAAGEGAAFGRADTEVAALLAERAAATIRHAREYDAVGAVAGRLQRALLAAPGRPHPNLEVALRYLPVGRRALVGGDWCETVRLHFGRTLLVVGDVMGHGPDAAVDMAAYRSSLRYIASADLPPHRVLRQLDALAAREPDRRPATCLIARTDPVRGLVSLASAGHPPPAVIGADGRVALLDVPVGPPLGTGHGGYGPATHRLAPGQTLLLFTDGLVERRDEDIDRSLARLTGLRFPPGTGVEDMLDTVLARLDARDAEDDVAVLAARLGARTGGAGF